MERKGEGLRKGRKCGLDQSGEGVKNEEVVINSHSPAFGDGQLWTILTVIRDNWEGWSSSLPFSWWEGSQWSICVLFFVLCLLCRACNSWWLLSFLQLCEIPACGGTGSSLPVGGVSWQREGWEADFFTSCLALLLVTPWLAKCEILDKCIHLGAELSCSWCVPEVATALVEVLGEILKLLFVLRWQITLARTPSWSMWWLTAYLKLFYR